MTPILPQGSRQSMMGDRFAATCSRPSDQAAARLGGSRFDQAHGEPKIRLFVNHDHIALVMRRRRELGIGEDVR